MDYFSSSFNYWCHLASEASTGFQGTLEFKVSIKIDCQICLSFWCLKRFGDSFREKSWKTLDMHLFALLLIRSFSIKRKGHFDLFTQKGYLKEVFSGYFWESVGVYWDSLGITGVFWRPWLSAVVVTLLLSTAVTWLLMVLEAWHFKGAN